MPTIYTSGTKPMFATKSYMRRIFSAIAVTGCLLSGLPAITWAQGLPGLTIFSGVERQNELNYKLDYGTRDMWDRYRLRIPAKKMKLGALQFKIDYPDYYNGKFDPKKIQVWAKDKSLALQKVNWDKANHTILIELKEPLEPGKSVELVFDNVKNPDFGGTYYFNASILSRGDVPLPLYVGTWILSIN
jgi:hypothetical protein